jgi:hypothetical protein
MPKLPEGATPSRTCPDRYNCAVMRHGDEQAIERGTCPYLEADANGRPGIRAECLARKRMIDALKS